MPLFPKISFPAVRLPNFSSRPARVNSRTRVEKEALPSAQSSLPNIHSTPTTPSNKSFEKYIEEVSEKFSHDNRFVQGLVKYKNLKAHIQKMEAGKFGAPAKAEFIDEECAICLESLGNNADLVNTTCKHRFHTFCLIESLGEGYCSSCPMCRNGADTIVPSNFEGAQMRLLAKLRINIDQAEATHKSVAEEIEKNAKACINDIDGVNASKAKRLTYTNPKKKKELEARAGEIKERLQLLQEYDRVNVMGFSKICSKVSRKLSHSLGETLEAKYIKTKRYFKDFEGKNAKHNLRHLSQKLDKKLEELQATSSWKDKLWVSSADAGGDENGESAEHDSGLGSPSRGTTPRTPRQSSTPRRTTPGSLPPTPGQTGRTTPRRTTPGSAPHTPRPAQAASASQTGLGSPSRGTTPRTPRQSSTPRRMTPGSLPSSPGAVRAGSSRAASAARAAAARLNSADEHDQEL